MTADDTSSSESLTFTSAFKPGQKYLVVNTPSSNNTADVDRDGTAETYTKDGYITLHDPVATKLDASASNGAANFTGTASNAQLTITAPATGAGNIDVIIDGTTYTIASGVNTTTSTQATEIASDLNNDSAFAAKYVATASGAAVSIAPKAVAIPSGLKVIAIDEVFSNLQSEELGSTSSLSGLGLTQSEFSNNTVWVDEKPTD